MLIAAGGYMLLNSDQNDQNNPDDGDDGSDGNNQISDEWDVYYVQSGSDLPACESSTLGRLYYVADTAGFETCTTGGWQFVDLTGPAGANGADGAQGPSGTNGQDGADGAQGPSGTNGTDGTQGTDALAVTSVEPAGSNCNEGGIKIEVGSDVNRNGALDPSEVTSTQYVCDGAGGADGTNGSASANTMLTSISSPSPNLGCTSGGRVIMQGLDNGDGNGVSQNGILESGEVDYTTTYCSSFIVNRMADIRPGSLSGGAVGIKAMGTRLFFEGYTAPSGSELWTHDSINGSTWQVADINSGSGDGSPDGITVMGTRLYFEADDGVSGFELWAHETTNGSTWQVADIDYGGASGFANDITVMDTRLYFNADDGSSGYELWAHETTNGSTWQVADINSGSGGSHVYEMTVMGTRLYFEANDGVSGFELCMMEIEHTITYN